jgi:hypothetical protein
MDQRSPLSLSDYEWAASELGCQREVIQAVAQVESIKDGFFPNGHPKILFEGHIFHKYTKGYFDLSYPTLSFRSWTRKYYGKTWKIELSRFNTAQILNRPAAIYASSWGKFQIMGFNWGCTGSKSEEDFVRNMKVNEQEHLKAFVSLLKSWKLNPVLASCDWRRFAKVYNGAGYEANNYHKKLETAYETLLNY